MATTLKLFCIISGEFASNAFPISISSTDTISNLKDLIKAKKAPEYDDISADRLKLWHITIPVDDDSDDEVITATSITTKRLLEGTGKISKAFGIEVPENSSGKRLFKGKGTPSRTFKDGIPEDTIHIIVEWLLAAKDKGYKNFIVSLDSPTKNFSSYTWKDAQSQYGVGEPELIPGFDIQPKLLLDNEKTVLKHIIQDCVFKNKAYLLGPGASEAAKSSVVDSFMVGAIQSYDSDMFLAQQLQMSGMRGHGAVDFAVIDRIHHSQVLSVTEVKKEDFAQGLAQNMAELDVAVQQKKRKRMDEVDEDSGERPPVFRFKSYGIVTDSFKWILVECALDEEDVLTYRTKDIPGILDLKQGGEDAKKDCEKVFSYVLALYELMKDEIANRSAYGSPTSDTNPNKRMAI
ncbi:hypothetical protein BG011_004405 [Mortierella polycephala]|uniref:Crinkler effector protein N-terminal domain-containing protein n=1 Tax=Mortierella polycephala TaxID=41804 RepID=A0A9P6QER4_9FUNG|nr:hypothetical protein BG011_004405 [Mortierella polycephala]